MNYQNIAAALEYYQREGYVYVPDAPWYVGDDAYNATRPAGATELSIRTPTEKLGNLVASGEQSFIQMMLDGQPLKRAICVTPCFRWEKKLDSLRHMDFMKAELINAQDVDKGHLVHMISEACHFFKQYLTVRVIETGEWSYDIVEKDTRIELGSYGIRRMFIGDQELAWIYGTACAEPRLSTVTARRNPVTR